MSAPDKKNMQDEKVPEDAPVEGRLYDSRNPEFKKLDSKDDISYIDKQEGEMNHGTTVVPDHSNESNNG